MMNKHRLPSIALAASLLIGLTACASGNTDNAPSGNQGGKEPTVSEQPGGATGATADPFGKYDPPIEVTAARHLDQVATQYKEGESVDNNVWTRLYEEYGIKIKYDWTTSGPEDQYNQKLNIGIASGSLPEMFSVNAIQLKQLADSGQLADLTEVFDQYASPELKEIIAQDPSFLKSSTFDGKLLAIPSTQAVISTGTDILFMRNDWLKKLNLPEPKTMDDLLAIAEAFVKQDPDGNSKDDTFGLLTSKENMPAGFMNGYHAYPSKWVQGADGQLAYGSIQPEMKQALAKLQEMYKNGLLDKEFGVKDFNKMMESVNADKLGILYGPAWIPWVVIPMIEQNPDAEWKAFPIPSADDKPAKPIVPFAVNKYYVVTKAAKHPEVLIKLMNLFQENMYGATADPAKYSNDGQAEVWHYSFVNFFNPQKDVINFEMVGEAMKSGDPSKLNSEQKVNYDGMKKYLDGDNSQWIYNAMYAETGPLAVLTGLTKNDGLTMDAFYGPPTQTQSDKNSVLQKMENETFINIVMGGSLDLFDKFVSDWKSLGGDDITKEVNEWHNSLK